MTTYTSADALLQDAIAALDTAGAITSPECIGSSGASPGDDYAYTTLSVSDDAMRVAASLHTEGDAGPSGSAVAELQATFESDRPSVVLDQEETGANDLVSAFTDAVTTALTK